MDLQECLNNIQCPINWELPNSPLATEETRKKVLVKVGADIEEDDSTTWQMICQCFVMATLEYREKDFKQMESYLKRIDEMTKAEAGPKLKKDHLPPIEYVKKGMEAFLLDKQGDDVQTQSLLLTIPPFDQLSQKNQAAIYALKACCLMEFAYHSSEESIKAIDKALELHSEDIEWNFLKGKCLARNRRLTHNYAQPSIEELKYLGKAAKSEDCSASHLVFTGQSMYEYGQSLYAHGQYSHRDREEFFKKSADLFRRAAEKGADNGVVLVRVAKGLMHMFGYGIEDLLEHCVFRSLELLPDSGFVNAVVGEFYLIRRKDYDTAIKYLRIAARDHHIISSYRYLLGILFLRKSDQELEEEMEIYWNIFNNTPLNRMKSLKTMTAYYFFIKNDVVKASKLWKEVMSNDSKFRHESSSFIYCENMTSALVGEINCVLNDPENELDVEDEEALRSFQEAVHEAHPGMNITHKTPRLTTIQRMIDLCREDEKREILIQKYNLVGASRGPSRYNRPNDRPSEGMNYMNWRGRWMGPGRQEDDRPTNSSRSSGGRGNRPNDSRGNDRNDSRGNDRNDSRGNDRSFYRPADTHSSDDGRSDWRSSGRSLDSGLGPDRPSDSKHQDSRGNRYDDRNRPNTRRYDQNRFDNRSGNHSNERGNGRPNRRDNQNNRPNNRAGPNISEDDPKRFDKLTQYFINGKY